MEKLRKINAIAGKFITDINTDEDDDVVQIIDEFANVKMKDMPKVMYDALSESIAEFPEELKELTMGEMMDLYLSGELDDD